MLISLLIAIAGKTSHSRRTRKQIEITLVQGNVYVLTMPGLSTAATSLSTHEYVSRGSGRSRASDSSL